jgi:uncharacterized membrane protein
LSHLIAITFDGPEQAAQALRALRRIERRGLVHVTDTAVIRKDSLRPVYADDAQDGEATLAVTVVGTLGPPVAIARRLAGIATGVSQLHRRIDWEFLALLRADLRHGTSALLVMVADITSCAVLEIHQAMRPFHGTVYETTLLPEPWQIPREVARRPCDSSITW